MGGIGGCKKGIITKSKLYWTVGNVAYDLLLNLRVLGGCWSEGFSVFIL